MGISNGGRIAVGFAIAHPERTRSLIAANAALDGTWVPPEFKPYFVRAHATAISRGTAAAKEELITTFPAFFPAMANVDTAAKIRRMTRDFHATQFIDGDSERPSAPDAVHRLGSIKVPTLAIAGEYDTSYNRAIGHQIAKEVPKASLIDLKRVGHFTALENPPAFNAGVATFLSGPR